MWFTSYFDCVNAFSVFSRTFFGGGGAGVDKEIHEFSVPQ
jgi:hypothetical protein